MSEPDKPPTVPSVHDIAMRLRDWGECSEDDLNQAADMLEFFLNQMQAYDVKMDGQHRYRFASGGWPMKYCVGPNREDAVKSAIREIKRSRSE